MSEMLDRLAKMVAAGSSRRDVLRALGGFLVGGFLTGFTGKARADEDGGDDDDDEEEEERRRRCERLCRRLCKTDAMEDRCESRCRRCPRKRLCGTETCNGVTCCKGSATCCTPKTKSPVSTCVNLQTNVTNCGACNAACTTKGSVCCAGRCCPPPSDGVTGQPGAVKTAQVTTPTGICCTTANASTVCPSGTSCVIPQGATIGCCMAVMSGW